ncbi:MAG: response regulator [Alphaproteobacteria bacterium]|nr:response regulator [Alphaproteobacteria bacterium]
MIGVNPVAQDSSLYGINILVIEDHRPSRDLLKSVLTAFGATDVRTCADGSEGLRAIREHRPDLILADWSMEPMDGKTFLKELRKAENYPASIIPVIVVTAFGLPETVRAALDAGANQFVVKPIVPLRLRERIIKTLADAPQFELAAGGYEPSGRKEGRPLRARDEGEEVWDIG